MLDPQMADSWYDYSKAEIERLRAEKAAAVQLAQARIDDCRELREKNTRLELENERLRALLSTPDFGNEGWADEVRKAIADEQSESKNDSI